MKTFLFGLFFLVILLFVPGCNEDDENNNDGNQETEWDFDVEFSTAAYPGITYNAVGTAIYKRTGDNFTITCSYSVGQITHNDIVIEGTINDQGELVFTTTQLLLEFDFGSGIEIEEVNFTVDQVNYSGNQSTGSGTVHQRFLPDGEWEDWTFTYTATKKSK